MCCGDGYVGINDASTGTLSSYAYCILAIHFLQSQGLLPDLQVRTLFDTFDHGADSEYLV